MYKMLRAIVVPAYSLLATVNLFGADVRNSNWGDTPEVVRNNQEEVDQEHSTDPRIRTLSGTTVIDGLPLWITYSFFDNALVQVSLIASFNQATQGSSNRQPTWNPFHDALKLSVLLRAKYGPETDRQFSLNYNKVGLLDAKDWHDRMPREAFQKEVWATEKTTIELFANTHVTSNNNYRVCSVTYKDKGRRSDEFSAYQAALLDKARKQTQENALKGL